MSCKTLSLILCGLALWSGSVISVSAAGEKSLRVTRVSAEYAVTVLGQEAAEKPSFLDKIKERWSKLTRDPDEVSPNTPTRPKGHQTNQASTPTAPPTRVTPPRPVTVAESQNGAADNKESTANDARSSAPAMARRTTTTTTPSRAATSGISADTSASTQSAGTADDASVFDRMKEMRESRFAPRTTDRSQANNSDAEPMATRQPQREEPAERPAFRQRQESADAFLAHRQRRTDPSPTVLEAEPSTTVDESPKIARQIARPHAFEPINETSLREQPTRDTSPFGMPATEPTTAQRQQASARAPVLDVYRPTPAATSPKTTVSTSTTDTPWNKNQSAPRTAASTPATFGHSDAIMVEPEDAEKSVLVSPLLEVETIRPQRVIVGQESAYRIRLFNRGGATAEQVLLQVDLPDWIDIQPPEVSAGTTSVSQPKTDTAMNTFTWKVDRIGANAEEQLVLHLVPKERKSFNLKLHYDFKRPTTIAPIEVQEPTLEMAIDGPNELPWGVQQLYQLRIRNTGNGDAEKVKLTLLSGPAENQRGTEMYVIERLAAGAEEIVKINADALQENFLDICVMATGPYDLQAKATKRINILRSKLEASVEAPEMLFVGNRAEYTVRVRNFGTAPAEKVEIRADIPLGAKYLSNNAGGRATPQNTVVWNTETIPVGGEFTAKFTCELKRQGMTKVEIAVSERTGQTVACSGSTHVESVADLKMKIENPPGPVEVGADAVYTIIISNNGTKEAEGVDVSAMFGFDIKPIAVEGLPGEIVDSEDISKSGIVTFQRIPTVSAGQTLPPIKIRARAEQPGNHKIRVELACDSTGSHLVHEESAYYYVKRGVRATSPMEPAAPQIATKPAPPVESEAVSPFAPAVPIAPEPIQGTPTPKSIWDQ